jgi:hypothetical protein
MDGAAPYRPKFGFDIRIRPPEEERVRADTRHCEWPGCEHSAEHRAPKSRQQLDEHKWYCLSHVREFNSHWDFFAGLSDDEVRAFQETASFGHRPTWRFGTVGSSAGMELNARTAHVGARGFGDPFGMFRGRRTAARETPRGGLSLRQAKAFDVFSLDEAADSHEIRRRYTALVKRFHPDSNGGDRAREERLREVIDAYRVLKSAGYC